MGKLRHAIVMLARLLVLGGAALPAWGAACIFVPQPGGGATTLHDGKEVVELKAARYFDPCARVQVAKGSAQAHFVANGKPEWRVLSEGQRVDAAALAGGAAADAPIRSVGRSILAVLTEGKETVKAGQKFFEKPAQVGAPFGDVFIPPEGLVLRFVNLEGDARVSIVDDSTRKTLFEAVAAQGVTLERALLRAGGRYTVQVTSARAKLVPGAFEITAAQQSAELDQALQAIAADRALDAAGRAIARALLFEHEGLSFNREVALRELKP
jgi:hypothetical protein